MTTHLTKSGKNISFTFEENIEKINRGFVVHKVIAFVDGTQVGYLKISYVDPDEFKKLLPDGIYGWIDEFLGKGIYPIDIKSIKKLSIKELSHFISRLTGSHYILKNKEEFMTLLADYEKSYEYKIMLKKYKEFLKFHVNKPLVDFINTSPSPSNGNMGDYTRQGVATALYLYGATRMKERNMKLYASGLQSDEAALAWNKLSSKGLVAKDSRGRYVKQS